MSSVESTVRDVAQPIAEELGFELANVQYIKEGKNWFLRLYIDHPNGISLDDCVMVSDKVGEALDSLDPDPIPQAYFLEVSSLGAERPIEADGDYAPYIDKYIQVNLHQAVEGESTYRGDLLADHGDSIEIMVRIKTRDKNILIEKTNIAKAQLTVKI